MTRHLGAYLLAIVVLLAAVVFSPSGGDWLWLRTLHDFAHGPVFGCVAIIVLIACRGLDWFATRPVHIQYLSVFVIAVTLGGASEVAQLFSGRDPTWSDFGTDVLGAASFLLICAAFDKEVVSGSRAKRHVFVFAAVGATALLVSPLMTTAFAYAQRSREFPVIVDFPGGIGTEFLTTRLVDALVERLPERFSVEGERALLIEFQPGRWQGIDMREPPVDWRGYTTLVLDVVNPTDEELKIVLRIDDLGYNGPYHDRYNGRFDIAPQTRSVMRIPLSEIETAPRDRSFNLSNITRVLLFRQHESGAPAMYLVGMKLVRDSDEVTR